MKLKKIKRSTVVMAIVLACLLLFSVIFVPLFNSGKQLANAATDTENVYNAGNTFEATIKHRTDEYTDADGNKTIYTFDFATYDLSKRIAGNVVSKNPPQVTFVTHGLGGSAGHWSNDGNSNNFAYETNSIIELLKQKAECNVYIADFDKINNNIEFVLYQVTDDKGYYFKNNNKNNLIKVDKITDNTRHSIVLFQAFDPDGPNDYIYMQFNLMASKVVSYLAELDANHELPRVNLIGHSRGGLTNLQYALDHPDLVDSIFSIGTPYVGSTSASIDVHILDGYFAGGPGEDDIINPDKYTDYMNRWNDGYNEFYSNIKVHSIGGYESLDTLIYSIIRMFTEPSNILRMVAKYVDTLVIKYMIEHPLNKDIHRLVGLCIDAIVSSINFKQKINVLPGLTAALEFLFTEFVFNPMTLSYDIHNDILVDLPSQLGYERETKKHFNGFIKYTRRYGLLVDLEKINANEPDKPRIMHNLEAHDLDILTYIVSNINISHNLNGSPYLVAVMGENEVSIIGYIGKNAGDTLSIPEQIYVRGKGENMTVTGIGERVFSENLNEGHNIKKIVVPKTVKYIGDYAFYNNQILESVQFEQGSELVEIGEGAFLGVKNVNTFNIPSNVTYIGEKAFVQSGIQSFVSQSNNFSWNAEQGLLINNNLTDASRKAAIYANPVNTSFTIPDDVKILGSSLFYGYENLKSVDLNKTESIGLDVFAHSGITELLGGENVQDADLGAFFCTPWYPENDEDSVAVGQVLIKAPTGKEEIIVPEGFTRIGADAFSGTDVVSVVLPSTIESIGQNAFNNCEKLEWVLIKALMPPMTDGDCFAENVDIYTPSIGINRYRSSMFFADVKDNIKEKPVNVSFYNEDGDLLGVKTEHYHSLFDNYIIENIPGQSFAYWLDDNGNKILPRSLFSYDTDVSLTAYYEKDKYQVSLGDSSMTLEYGQEVDFGIPEKEDCVFVGWFDQNGNQITDESGICIWTYERDITLQAIFEGITHNIIYITNGGDFDGIEPTEFSATNVVTLEDIPTLKKFGYVFEGWRINNYNGNYFETTSGITHDIRLVAIWSGDKVEAKSGTNSVTTEYAIYDMTNKSTSATYKFEIYSNVKYVSFIGVADREFTNMNIVILGRSSALVMGFENMNFHPSYNTSGLSGIDAISCNSNFQLFLTYSGRNTIIGGHGNNGAAVSGQDGGDGGYGIRAYKVVLQSFSSGSQLKIKGGDGGNGGTGENGRNGANGIRPPRGSIFKPVKGDDGEAGGNGSRGGNGGNGGYAIYASYGTNGISFTNNCIFTFVGGNGGHGAKGGYGGDGGKGADDTSTDPFTGVGDPGNGGRGGNGGDGGNGGNGARATNCNVISTGGKGGGYGEGGACGIGGQGGIAGSVGANGSKGANGAWGADGKAGSDAVSSSPRDAIEIEDYPYFFNEAALSRLVTLGD